MSYDNDFKYYSSVNRHKIRFARTNTQLKTLKLELVNYVQ